jgi:hypothetical protein
VKVVAKESGTDKNSWIQVVTGQKKKSQEDKIIPRQANKTTLAVLKLYNARFIS